VMMELAVMMIKTEEDQDLDHMVPLEEGTVLVEMVKTKHLHLEEVEVMETVEMVQNMASQVKEEAHHLMMTDRMVNMAKEEKVQALVAMEAKMEPAVMMIMMARVPFQDEVVMVVVATIVVMEETEGVLPLEEEVKMKMTKESMTMETKKDFPIREQTVDPYWVEVHLMIILMRNMAEQRTMKETGEVHFSVVATVTLCMAMTMT